MHLKYLKVKLINFEISIRNKQINIPENGSIKHNDQRYYYLYTLTIKHYSLVDNSDMLTMKKKIKMYYELKIQPK